MPAIVLRSGEGTADVVLADGNTVTLDAASSRWTGRTPAALLKRGDLARVRRIDPVVKEEETPDPEAKPAWRLEQLPRAQSTLVSMEPENGALRALIGGFSFAGQKFNRATQARRQPGSSFKPFIYAAAFERGFNPASIVLDAPVVFRMRRGQVWRPQNDNGQLRRTDAAARGAGALAQPGLGATARCDRRRLRAALHQPLRLQRGRTAAEPVDLARHTLADADRHGARLCGVRQRRLPHHAVVHRRGQGPQRQDDLQGESSARLPRLRAARRDRTRAASNIVDGFDLGPARAADAAASGENDGDEAQDNAVAPAEPPKDAVMAPRAIDERVAYQLVSMMRDVVQRGTGTAAKVLEREDVGGKTGSTNDHRDAWFSGFGGNLVTTVWVGRDDNRSLGYREYGGKAALPIWIDFMRVALKDVPIAGNEPPDGMVKVAVSASGRLLPTTSEGGIVEYVKAEDLERMESYVDYTDEEIPSEEAFDIF